MTSETIEVSNAESPIPNTTGVKMPLNEGGYLYAVSTIGGANITIAKNSAKTNGDKSGLVDQTFFEFGGASEKMTKVVLERAISAVYQCSLIEKVCERLSVGLHGDHSFFVAKEGYFYAIEK